jgi:hypothetical protein
MTDASTPARSSKPSGWIAIVSIACGLLGAATLDRPFHGTGMFLLCTIATGIVSAIAYSWAARAFGWPRIDLDALINWLPGLQP